MRSMGGHYQNVPFLHLMGLTSNLNLKEPLEDKNESVVRCSMLAQPFALVEGKESQSSRLLIDDCPADD